MAGPVANDIASGGRTCALDIPETIFQKACFIHIFGCSFKKIKISPGTQQSLVLCWASQWNGGRRKSRQRAIKIGPADSCVGVLKLIRGAYK